MSKDLTPQQLRALDIAVHTCIAGEPSAVCKTYLNGVLCGEPTWNNPPFSHAPEYTTIGQGHVERILVDGLPNGWWFKAMTRFSGREWSVETRNEGGSLIRYSVWCVTPNIAVCIAVLRAYGKDTKEWE